jgi:diguanylate cyclase (GGDEF)-like protein/PAS domain S-box-containing protein
VRHRNPMADDDAGPPVHLDPYAQIVDHGPDAICIHQDGHFVFFNAVAVRWLGARSTRELLGHGISRFVHARSIPTLVAGSATLRRPGDVSGASLTTLIRLDGSELQVEAVSVLSTWHGALAYQLVLRELSEHRALHDALVHQAALVDHVSDAIIAITQSGMVTSWNPAAERIYRRPAHRALALPIETAVGAPVDLAAISAAGGVVHANHRAMDGSVLAMRVSVTEFERGFVVMCSDETTMRRAARNLRTVVNTLQEGVVVIDRNGWLLTVNPAARRILGISPGHTGDGDDERLRALPIFDETGRLLTEPQQPVHKAFATGLPTLGRVFGLDRPDGTRVWLSISCQLLHPSDRDHSPVLMSFTDITAQRETTEHLAHRAAHDMLTGLPNRRHIVETVDALNRQGGLLTAVLFIDLDDLKTVNDNFGHDAGDLVIQATADRLRGAVRKHDIVGRLAGDEFVALLIGNREPSDLDGLVGRIRRILNEPIEISGGTLHVAASIGVVRTTGADSRDAATLLRDADSAMYAAKAKGRRASHFSRPTPGRHSPMNGRN